MLLYFVYTARIAPDTMSATAPSAEFQFIAHLPGWGLSFPINDANWGGGLPSVQPEDGHTVWGAVFKVPESDIAAIHGIEEGEHRIAIETEAMDRMGKRHQVITHVAADESASTYKPSADYVRLMMWGSRHWSLPAGWIAGLDEHLDNAS